MKIFKYIFLFLLLLILVGGGVLFYLAQQMLQPVDASQTETVSFEVPKGQPITRIGERLTEQGLIRHPLVFRLMVRQLNAANKIQAGTFELSPSMTPEELIAGMSQGTDDVWIKLLEGWRREEMAESIASLELPEFDEEEFLELTDGLEGYLFPDSYLIQRGYTTEQIVNLLTDTFEQKVEVGLKDEIAEFGKSLEDVVVMASIIEREARGDEQMRMVSGVLWNRMDIGMALNVDATLQYIKGYDRVQKSWWAPPLAVDKERESPYNTYKYAGLPPAPIANPSLGAIKAALNPAETEYFYYLHDPTGRIHYGVTLDEHNVNVQRYLR